MLEVADIIDELKMIRHLVDKQREVLKTLINVLIKLNPSGDDEHRKAISQTIQIIDNAFYEGSNMNLLFENQNHESIMGLAESSKILAQKLAVPARHSIEFIEDVLASLLTEIDDIRNDADYTHKMVSDLFH